MMRETLADSNRPEATCVGFREFVSTFFQDRLFRSAVERTEVGDDCDGVFVFHMVDVHGGTNCFAVCADSFFEDI